ncbi:dihydrofolate reductase family protein [Jidongwangia harbinensis]|uniref:dihydrofolate reductase family protein n=1 Tax=Jidongwangia harbinensis TaxID=2878561 RepID=UPI001CD9C5A8|nr:dihydrofolate reductase family protein [Jidongwangia harbinensis]MCA2218557.1 dihydrofolate reductase family protein [Jidongwangia harbinensis]
MSKVVGDITVSLDGFVTGPDPDLAHGLGRGGDELHRWVTDGDAVDAAVLAETSDATGAVIMGRRVFDFVDGPHGWTDERGYGGPEAGMPPVLVVTRTPPESTRLGERFTFVVDGIGSAVTKAVALAEGRDVVIMGGATVIRGALERGLLDELRLHLAPVLLGAGTPLFDGGSPRVLRQTHVRPSGHATHLSYRVG